MGYKKVIVSTLIVASITAAVGFQAGPQGGGATQSQKGSQMMWSSPDRKDKVTMTESDWRKKLTGNQYQILRQSATEAAFANAFYNNHAKGTYYCAGCGLPLFSSSAKFESGTGWPSFFKPIASENVWYLRDNTMGMQRVEVRCSRCDGHLGHIFDDAPQTPTGLRYCMNSGAMTFKKE